MKTDDKIQKLVGQLRVVVQRRYRIQCCKMTNKHAPYPMLFSPIKINSLTIKNRLVMAPMGNINMAEETGRPNEK